MAINICNSLHLASTQRSESKINLWRAAVAIIAAVTIARLIYMIWLSPYELAGDEAYYWEQARHFDLCYDEKGPALAWMIAAFMKLFGDSEWVIRLPVIISFTAAAWGIGRLTISLTGGNQRAGFWAVVFFCLMPAFNANAQIITQDGPLTGAMDRIGGNRIADHPPAASERKCVAGLAVFLGNPGHRVLVQAIGFAVWPGNGDLLVGRKKNTSADGVICSAADRRRWHLLRDHQSDDHLERPA